MSLSCRSHPACPLAAVQTVLTHYQQATPQEFETVFSALGGQISLVKVCERLCAKRAAEDEQLALHARDDLGKTVTTYRKGLSVHTTSSNRVIA